MYEQPVILFDGVCNLCNHLVKFVIRRNKKEQINFAPLQSKIGQKLLGNQNLKNSGMDSFIFIDKGEVFTQSTAALKVCKYLDGLWPLMIGFIIVPRFIRDGIYNYISKNRYHWFGKKDECMLPTTQIKSRFLNSSYEE